MSSYLTAPNIYLELARTYNSNFKIVVNERSSYLHSSSAFKDKMKAICNLLHIRADAIVSNSFHQNEYLKRWAFLKSKCHVIWNGFNVNEFRYEGSNKFKGKNRFLVVGRISPEKNGQKLIRSIIKYFEDYDQAIKIDWAGREGSSLNERLELKKMKELLSSNPNVYKNWNWLGEVKDMQNLYNKYDCSMFAKYEGLPNVVCEAMLKGCLVLASNVCDHPFC